MKKNHFWLARESIALLLLALSLFLLFSSVAPSYCGDAGKWCLQSLNNWWGYAKFFVPVGLIAFSFSLFCETSSCLFRGVCFLMMTLCIDSLGSLFFGTGFGQIGLITSDSLEKIAGSLGAAIFLLSLLILSIQNLFSFSWKSLFGRLSRKNKLIL